jgi:hypothetical protein
LEGGQQRCFKQMFVCHNGINITKWPLHGLGLRLVDHYRTHRQHMEQREGGLEELAALDAAAAAGVATQAALAAEAGAAAAGDGSSKGGKGDKADGGSSSEGGERQLRIVFHRRSSPDRQLLNVAELIEQCNAWRYTTKAGQRLRASCIEVSQVAAGLCCCQFGAAPCWPAQRAYVAPGPIASQQQGLTWPVCPSACLRGCVAACLVPPHLPALQTEPKDLFSGMAAAQEADIFVGVHGANMANGWLMRPGASMVELQPWGFDSGPAHLQYPLFNMEVSEAALSWRRH